MSFPTSSAFVRSDNSQNGLQAEAPGKLREHLFINFVQKNIPWAPTLRNVKLQNDPLANGQRQMGKGQKAKYDKKNNSRNR